MAPSAQNKRRSTKKTSTKVNAVLKAVKKETLDDISQNIHDSKANNKNKPPTV